MTELFIDVGNTRVKFAIVEQGEYEYMGGFTLAFKPSTENFLEIFSRIECDKVNQVYVSSVASFEREHMLVEAVNECWAVFPIFLKSQASCCNLTNGYENPFQLGVDRWMAMIALHAKTTKPFIVVDAGSAITLDVVHNSSHLGGFIAPGLTMMRNSLAQKSDKLNIECQKMGESLLADSPDNEEPLLARNTTEGVCGGTLYMAASFVNYMISDLENSLHCHFKVYVTGGDGLTLSPLLNSPNEYIEDLVLQGMVNVKENVKNS
ncbi:type III pantothenate kinase [Thiomicrorhabdus sp. zzn3]|uniref:type III pantothenate kinase n=1 Tax=Thiomicrorhabdus sp. zzn3 TaxID=3039775 RepID=UPI0024370791|nr:type III pantothenate kinase [Thiomicrorhabdus sp. zzn3]MDG6777081.1 type III pantothenate kinase [Thiomicrorhabdus sp. zzn3]